MASGATRRDFSPRGLSCARTEAAGSVGRVRCVVVCVGGVGSDVRGSRGSGG